jgi:hypothetical protein
VPLGNLQIDVVDDDIIVTLPESSYAITYYKPESSPHLITKRLSTEADPRASLPLSEFLGRAWWAANDKARELGWIA